MNATPSGPRTAPIAISFGEPAGIGPDLILQAYARRGELRLPAFAVYGHLPFLEARARRLGLAPALRPAVIGEAAAAFAEALPVVEIAGTVPDRPGEPQPVAAPAVLEAIARATADTLSGAARALVTAPIHKAALYGTGFAYPGHTEYLAALCARGGTPPTPVMMLAHEGFRAVPLTIHVPLAAVPGMVGKEAILRAGRIVARDLEARFGIAAPRLAVAGLNPHAGEDGTIGREEIEEIAPAVARLREEGIDAEGPLPADTLFAPAHWRRYDAAIAMYHDQALVPIKTLAFDEAVNVTLGLPIVRTSPDHGTALALAGTGRASASSFLAALAMADRMSRTRA